MGNLTCIVCDEPSQLSKAEALAEQLQLPINPQNPFEFTFQLQQNFDGLILHDLQGRKLEIDFLKDHLNYQRRGLRGKNELLAKALGFAKGARKVLDLSAGMGIDAVYLTQLGFEVTAIERSDILFALLADALSRAPELQKKLTILHDDSFKYLNSPFTPRGADSILFDPMYPHKKKTALPKQEMVVFRELVGNDDDAAQVLEAALKWPVGRVVVKRPIGAEELLPGVSHSHEGKVVRYDVYMRKTE